VFFLLTSIWTKAKSVRFDQEEILIIYLIELSCSMHKQICMKKKENFLFLSVSQTHTPISFVNLFDLVFFTLWIFSGEFQLEGMNILSVVDVLKEKIGLIIICIVCHLSNMLTYTFFFSLSLNMSICLFQ